LPGRSLSIPNSVNDPLRERFRFRAHLHCKYLASENNWRAPYLLFLQHDRKNCLTASFGVC